MICAFVGDESESKTNDNLAALESSHSTSLIPKQQRDRTQAIIGQSCRALERIPNRWQVSVVGEVVCAFGGAACGKGCDEGGIESVDCPGRGFAKYGLELGEELLDRVEIRAVGRQVEQYCACGFDRLSDTGNLMRAEIVHDDDIAEREGGNEELLDVSAEGLAVDRTVDDAGCRDLVVAQSGEKGAGLPTTVRDVGDQPLAASSSPIATGHIGGDTSLVDEDQPPWVQLSLPLSPGRPRLGDIGTLLLAGMECLFLCVSFRAFRKRSIDERPTTMPWPANCTRSSSSVASGCAARSA